MPNDFPYCAGAEAHIAIGGLRERHVEELRAHARKLQKMVTDKRPSYLVPGDGWVCFHCGLRFNTSESASAHFGDSPTEKPVCHTDRASRPAEKMAEAGATEVPADVVALVIAARNVAFGDQPSPEELRALDKASEAFASRVPWDGDDDAGRALQPAPWLWYVGENDEHFTLGPFASQKEAIEAGVGDELGEYLDDDGVYKHHFHIIEAQKAGPRLRNFIDTDDILERADEAVAESEFAGEDDDDGYFMNAVTDEQQADLSKRLLDACDQWQDANEIAVKVRVFSDTRNEAYIKVDAEGCASIFPGSDGQVALPVASDTQEAASHQEASR